jgi:hypothetical protein
LREEKRKEAIQQEREREARVAQADLVDGTTLNNLLFQILEADPTVARTGRANAPISAAGIKEIPFEWDSEAITLCIDQMTGQDALPGPLMAPRHVEERNALRAAVEPALAEDARGTVSAATSKRITDAVANFRSRFMKTSSELDPGYQEALDYFTTLASLTRLLNDPSMKAFLEKLDEGQERTVGDLVAFMNAHNLRFGAAASARQIEVYRRLVPILTAIRDQTRTEEVAKAIPDRTGDGLKSAAKQAFKGMTWDELEAHRKGQ